MEYVKGVPITLYCDDARLSVPERLDLFVPVCQAVQHAHQKGIIHRDLKPSNILVCLYDGRPVPKVIDFGLAKAVHGRPLAEHMPYTAHGETMGTPLYMSPEEANWDNLDIDTRSDVYSLGVILYELLSGSTPLEKRRFRQAAWHEMLRVIKEEEPPRPSARLSGSATPPGGSWSWRKLEPAKLSRLIRGDLDSIVMKALGKERGRRDESAGAFAEDVRRYRRDEPVAACPPSAAYRLRKFVRRNRGPVLTASLILLAAVGGLAGTTAGLLRAERARKDVVTAREAETAQRLVAEGERAVTRAVNEFLQKDLLRLADTME
jgi:eukaryotic-like serine/threonine-protein kinase